MQREFNFHNIITFLNNNSIVSNVEIISIDETQKRGFYKVRCHLIPSYFKLEIKFIKSENEFLYSYQLFSDTTLARWDNEPHYPELDNFPNHYHFREEIKESSLTGVPIKDINEVMKKISKIITNEDV